MITDDSGIIFNYNLSPAPSGSPISTQARAIDSTTIELSWELPPQEEQNGIVLSFQINVTVIETKATYLVNSTGSIVNITELHPHYGYSLAVAAVTAGGVGPYSQPISTITHEDGKLFHSYLYLIMFTCDFFLCTN